VLKSKNYSVREFISSRQFTVDVGVLGREKHRIPALLELDVTACRQLLQNYCDENNVEVSFTAWIVKCISQAIAEHKDVHAIRQGKNRLVLFDEIDISMLVEKELQGEKVPLPIVLRKTNEKSAEQIHQEIQLAKAQSVADEKNYVLGDNQNKWGIKFFLGLPQVFRLFIWRFILSNPHRLKEMMGTAVVTSVGMIGNIKGWLIPSSIHPIAFAMGSIVKKPGLIGDRIETREYLPLTVLIDHDVVDGAPAARFLSRLTEIVETGNSII
jgi:pyruvate/2-oxoglutarate dehydrogenase complex dihydrolipoamide acyltransferase (E2) component